LISTLTYRSRSAAPLPPEGLEGMLAQAKIRNRDLGVTGMLLFADDQFYQWLEGPPESVSQVWNAIQRDPRHSQIELIAHHRQSLRVFGDWDMKFVCRGPQLAELKDTAATQRPLPAGLIQLTAQLALKGDDGAIGEGLQELLAMGQDFLALHAALLEPAARLLGDWWLEDRIGCVEITIALSHLQTVVRRIGAAQVDRMDQRNAARHILIAPQPGEPHGLGAALVGDAFHRSGWRVTSEFPTTVEALETCVRSSRFDALTLCLSDVFDRVEQILPLADAIRTARAASCNRALVILAGGRLFRTRPDLAAFIGADAVYVGVAEAMAKTVVEMKRSERAWDQDVRVTPLH
jgi:hypothetical protein